MGGFGRKRRKVVKNHDGGISLVVGEDTYVDQITKLVGKHS